jgi:hypothetical protein
MSQIDPNDPGFNLDENSLRRMIRGILRTETAPFSTAGPTPLYPRTVDKPRLIRGRSTADQNGPVITIDTVTRLAGGHDPSGGNPDTVIRVANHIFPRNLVSEQWVEAIFSPNVLSSDNPLSGGERVDWELLETGDSGTNATFRRFVLAIGKFSTTDNVLVYWLDNDNNQTGTEVVYDPELLFAGQPEDYVGTEPGFHGIAQLRDDLGTAGTYGQRWEIVAMEGFARWVTGTYQQSGTSEAYKFTGVYTTRDQWCRKPPQDIGGNLRIGEVTDVLVEPIDGDVVLLNLLDSDGNEESWMPYYLPVAVKDRDAIVQVRSFSGGDPAGYPVPKQTGDVFPGKYGASLAAAAPADSDTPNDCWITDLRGHTILANRSFHLGKFVGLITAGTGVERPQFAISAPLRAVVGATTTAVRADTGTFLISALTPMYGNAPPQPLVVEQTFPCGYASGQLVMALETETGIWVNTPDAGKIRTSSADMIPEYGYDTFINHAAYNGTYHKLVYIEEVLKDVDTQNFGLRAFTDRATGTGNTGTAEIHSLTGVDLSVENNALKVKLLYDKYVVDAQLTGTGEYNDSVTGTDCGT